MSNTMKDAVNIQKDIISLMIRSFSASWEEIFGRELADRMVEFIQVNGSKKDLMLYLDTWEDREIPDAVKDRLKKELPWREYLEITEEDPLSE